MRAGAAAEVGHADAWGLEAGKPPSLSRFVVELDQRFLTELTHTTVLFNELFDQSGRRQLLKVRAAGCKFLSLQPISILCQTSCRLGVFYFMPDQ